MARDVHSTQNFVGGAKITGLPQGSATGEPVTYDQLNAVVEGVAWKDSVRAASTANVNLAAPGATIDGVTMVNGDRFLAKNQTLPAANGIYIWAGAATPATRATDASTFNELEGAVVVVEEGTTNVGSSWRQTQANGTLDTNDILWTAFIAGAGAATETGAGTVELATQAEADAGTDDVRAVTPLKMANWSGRKRKMSGTIGDASATSFPITHNFGTRDVQVEVYKNSGNYDTIIVDVTRQSINAITIGPFASAPGTNAFAYVILA